jgi:hypothetical protein
VRSDPVDSPPDWRTLQRAIAGEVVLPGPPAYGRVVTSFDFRTVPAPDVTNVHVNWSFSEAVAVIGARQAWAPVGPDELAAPTGHHGACRSVARVGSMLSSIRNTSESVGSRRCMASMTPR